MSLILLKSLIIKGIDKIKPDTTKNGIIFRNFMEEVYRHGNKSETFKIFYNKLNDFYRNYNKRCLDYINDDKKQHEFFTQNNIREADVLYHEINSINFNSDDIESLKNLTKYFEDSFIENDSNLLLLEISKSLQEIKNISVINNDIQLTHNEALKNIGEITENILNKIQPK